MNNANPTRTALNNLNAACDLHAENILNGCPEGEATAERAVAEVAALSLALLVKTTHSSPAGVGMWEVDGGWEACVVQRGAEGWSKGHATMEDALFAAATECSLQLHRRRA